MMRNQAERFNKAVMEFARDTASKMNINADDVNVTVSCVVTESVVRDMHETGDENK